MGSEAECDSNLLRKTQVLCSDGVTDRGLRTVGLIVRLPQTPVVTQPDTTPIFMLRRSLPHSASTALAARSIFEIGSESLPIFSFQVESKPVLFYQMSP